MKWLHLFFLHKLIYAGSHCGHCTSKVVRGQSKAIPGFTFNTHHGREVLLTFPVLGNTSN